MSTVNDAAQVRLWLRSCPTILRSKRFSVDYLAEGPNEYALYSVPTALRYHENILGDEVPNDIQTQNYIFASKDSYGADTEQNLKNLEFFQDVTAWILEQNAERNFPTIGSGEVKSITPTLSAYPAQVGSNVAKYQIQIKLTYRRV